MKNKNCENCGRFFVPTTQNQKYCTNECYKLYLRKKHAMERPTLTCPICGTEFIHSREHKSYCSEECRLKAKKKTNNFAFCKACGKQFVTNELFKNYCSEECQKKSINAKYYIWHKCEICGKEFMGNKGRKYCSVDCRTKAYVGIKHKSVEVNADYIIQEPKPKPKRKSQIDDINAQARALGLSYGQFKALEWMREHKEGTR